MRVYKKFLIKFVTYIILAWFVCQPLTEIGRYKPYNEMPSEEFEITHKELDAFLEVWGDMMQSSFAENFKGTSLKSGNQYPRGLKSWLKLHHWDIKRFFYDEQRIKDLIEYAEIKHQLKDNKKITKLSQINLNDMNKDLEKRLETTSYSNEELDLIEANLYQITEILAGKAILMK